MRLRMRRKRKSIGWLQAERAWLTLYRSVWSPTFLVYPRSKGRPAIWEAVYWYSFGAASCPIEE
jgi:hypothetical protein